MTAPSVADPPEEYRPTRALVRVVVVDDDADIRQLLRHKLSRDGMEVVGEAADGAEAVAVVSRTQPDVVVLDLDMPAGPGDQALPHILRLAPSAMVVVFSASTLADAGRQRLLSMGAFAYYPKSDASRLGELLAADLVRFRRMLDGEDAVPDWMTDHHGGEPVAVTTELAKLDGLVTAGDPG